MLRRKRGDQSPSKSMTGQISTSVVQKTRIDGDRTPERKRDRLVVSSKGSQSKKGKKEENLGKMGMSIRLLEKPEQ